MRLPPDNGNFRGLDPLAIAGGPGISGATPSLGRTILTLGVCLAAGWMILSRNRCCGRAHAGFLSGRGLIAGHSGSPPGAVGSRTAASQPGASGSASLLSVTCNGPSRTKIREAGTRPRAPKTRRSRRAAVCPVAARRLSRPGSVCPSAGRNTGRRSRRHCGDEWHRRRPPRWADPAVGQVKRGEVATRHLSIADAATLCEPSRADHASTMPPPAACRPGSRLGPDPPESVASVPQVEDNVDPSV
jgi:hypothetical protein